MSQLLLKTVSEDSIFPLVDAALKAGEREILTGIQKTKQKLSAFEKKYNITTSSFLKNPSLGDEMESLEWLGEYETLQRLQNKFSRLKEIQICT